MQFQRGILAVLVFGVVISATASETRETTNAVGDIADDCKTVVDDVRNWIQDHAGKNKITSLAWDFWQCMNDTEIYEDAIAVCDVIASIFKNIAHYNMAKDFFIEKQMYTACDLCDKASAYLDGVSDDHVKMVTAWAESQTAVPELAQAFREHGHALMKQLISAVYPHQTCSNLNSQCEERKRIPIPPKIKEFLKEALTNATHCIECNVCENGVLYFQMFFLPNPNLPKCLARTVVNNVCVLFNQSLPGIGTLGYGICVKLIETYSGNIVDILRTFLHSNLVCKSALKACTSEYSDNILECICDNVVFPPYLEWILPCHWQHKIS